MAEQGKARRLLKMKRQEFSKRTKVQRWDLAKGACEYEQDGQKCGKKLFPGDIEYHHVIPAALGGSNDIDNCRLYCRSHHRISTSEIDIPAISKSRRVLAAHIGAKRRPSRPMPGGRKSEWKKKMSGEVVRRKKNARLGISGAGEGK